MDLDLVRRAKFSARRQAVSCKKSPKNYDVDDNDGAAAGDADTGTAGTAARDRHGCAAAVSEHGGAAATAWSAAAAPLAAATAVGGQPRGVGRRQSVRALDPLDRTLAKFPAAAYGARWGQRSAAEVTNMSRMVVLTQEDGECWTRCCHGSDVKNASGLVVSGQCRPMHDAAALPGCSAACDQHGTQLEVFMRMKDAAKAAGQRPPHCVESSGRMGRRGRARLRVPRCVLWQNRRESLSSRRRTKVVVLVTREPRLFALGREE